MPARRARLRRRLPDLPVVLVATALVLVVVGIVLQGLAVGVAAVVPLGLATYLGQREERRRIRL